MQTQSIVFFFIISWTFCCGHEHSHNSHSHEPPAFKYSKAANQPSSEFEDVKSNHLHSEPKGKHDPIKNINEIWLHAMGSTLLISIAPFFILFLVPLDNTDNKQPLLKILLAFASGGLLGDAFLHLIPHATEHDNSASHSHSHDHGDHDEHGHSHNMSVGIWVLTGIVTFLIIEKTMRILKGGHGHSHNKPKSEKGSDAKNKSQKSKPQKEIKVAGYLNLAADFSHNFTDGLAIGSSYIAGNTIGIVTTITILFHEVPHEIGDFAILLQSGVSRKNALLLQLFTAMGALLGTAVSLIAQNNQSSIAATWILPFTAGGFIYVALVSVIPELLNEEKPSLWQTLLQVLAIMTGISLMVVISIFE